MKPHYILTPFGAITRDELELDKAYELAFIQHRYRNYPEAVVAGHLTAVVTEYDYFLGLFSKVASKQSRSQLSEIANARRIGVAHGKEAAPYRPGFGRDLKARK